MLYSTNDLAFAYDGRIVLQKLNFDICEGDYFCIAGVNGSGKSTFLKGLLRSIKPAYGNLTVHKDLGGKIGYLPQQSAVQKEFPAGVFEIVLSGCLRLKSFLHFYTAADKKIAVRSLKQLNILNLKNCCFSELSGGQQRRVLLARALCATAEVLLLDEPAAGLDPIAAQDLYELLKQINKNLNITIVMVTHDINCALNYANKILHLQNEQLFFGTTEEYMKSEICAKTLANAGEHQKKK
ncbi:MAG: metal ABC transporter ATP-binding protein [Termitinemataceae bacterium]|nr:MAG: metal ABC transporter ATP-binding protein [Termitinemataceae bacterium]